MCRKTALSIMLTTLILTSTVLLSLPVNALDSTFTEGGERQLVVYGNLNQELFPEYNYSYWQKRGISFGFTACGEMVTDQGTNPDNPYYGVGLTYPTEIDYSNYPYVDYPSEHTATPVSDQAGAPYTPVEGWQLYWRWASGSRKTIDPGWHLSMAVYGNVPEPSGYLARLDISFPTTTIITNTSRLFIAETVLQTEDETLWERFGWSPNVIEISCTFVFYKATKKIIQFWRLEYLLGEAVGIECIFRRLTAFAIDNKFQHGGKEGFAVFFPSSRNSSTLPGPTGLPACETSNMHHAFWTGCDYWPYNYSLALVWTNASVHIWDPPEGESNVPQHHIGFVAYYPNCSNWDTDNWFHFTYSLGSPDQPGNLFYGEGLGRRFGQQPFSVEASKIDAAHYTGANLLMGQWNFTLTASTARRKAQFVNVIGITNCSETFGYHGGHPTDPAFPSHRVGDLWSGDWNSLDGPGGLSGGRTISEIKYMLADVFNCTYKLSSDWVDAGGLNLDLSNWYPFTGVVYDRMEYVSNNTWIKKRIGWDARNTTFICGESSAHYGSIFTHEAASVIDVVGDIEVGADFGSCVGLAPGVDPWFVALCDASGFTATGMAPFSLLGGAYPDFYTEVAGAVYFDPVPVTWRFTGLHRRGERNDWTGRIMDLFTTSTGASWDINHTVSIGGPKVNLATEYFMEHSWAVWTSAASSCEIPELIDGGIYVIPSGNYYVGDGYSIVTIVEDLNLTSWTCIHDEEQFWTGSGWNRVNTDCNPAGWVVDGPTLVDPYAALLIWGISGWDTRAACNWFAHYRCNFNTLWTNATVGINGRRARGAVAVVLYTPKVASTVGNPWDYGVKEILGTCAGRWRLSTTAWGVWIEVPVASLDWQE